MSEIPTSGRSRLTLPALFVAVAIVAFALLRLGLWLSNAEPVGGVGTAPEVFGVGLVYDLAALSYFIAPFVLYLLLVPQAMYRHPLHRWITYFVFDVSLYGLYFDLVAEWLFWDEFGTRFNFISVDYLIYRHEVTDNIKESYNLPVLLSAIGVAAALNLYLLRRPINHALQATEPLKHRLGFALPLLLLPLGSYYLLDEGLRQFDDNRYHSELAGNGPYAFFHALRDNSLDFQRFYAHGDVEQMSNTLRAALAQPDTHFLGTEPFDIRRTVDNPGRETRHNVILVTVESLSADFLGSFGNKEGITPNLDRLSEQGMLFTDFYATGTRTTRGLEAITLSIPPTPGRSLVKRPNNQGLYNLGSEFQARGYRNVFLYGGYGYFDNMNAFYSGNGYEIVDREQFTESELGFANAWGMADEYLFNRTIGEADTSYQQGKPFFFHLMTTSNHRPYTYPDGRIDIPSGSGRAGAVKYTDWAIGDFIDTSRTKPWFENTVFVIVADHCAGSAGRAALPVDRYHIPLLIYAPGIVPARQVETLSSQIDVAPTLLAILGFDYTSRFFGKNILTMQPDDGRALIGNYQKLGLFNGRRLAYLAPRKETVVLDHTQEDRRVKTPQGDSLLQTDIAYYQGADYVLRHGYNLAPPGPEPDSRQLAKEGVSKADRSI